MKNVSVFGNKLVELRKREGLTQIQLAKKINVDVKAIKNWESGLSNPCIESVISVANYFNVTSDELLGIYHKGEVIMIPDTISETNRDRISKLLKIVIQAYISIMFPDEK